MITVYPQTIHGQWQLPASKSLTVRAILFAALAKGESILTNVLPSSDMHKLCQIICYMGASYQLDKQTLIIQGCSGKPVVKHPYWNLGNSGIGLRFCTAIASIQPQPLILSGDLSLRQRPMHDLLQGLSALGLEYRYLHRHNLAPILLKPQHSKQHDPCTIKLLGQDSQPVSACLIAAAIAKRNLNIQVQNPGEKPWVQMTLDCLQARGIHFEHDGQYQHFSFKPQTVWPGFTTQIPGDISTLAFPLATALLTHSDLKITGIKNPEQQGDWKFISLLQQMGAKLSYNATEGSLFCHKQQSLHGIHCNIEDCIDTLPILAVLACFAQGESQISGAAMAREKECDRLHIMCRELTKMGAKITEYDHGLHIHGSPSLKGANFKHENDHRVAMALYAAASAAQSPSTFLDLNCCHKTFPKFEETMLSLAKQSKSVK
jgi:3-phosphoshikimate 1-carboxyvinyltransferase